MEVGQHFPSTVRRIKTDGCQENGVAIYKREGTEASMTAVRGKA